ncbi:MULTISPECIES: POT family MFS transporter [Shewanella]|uniref:POT family MFS transporter n=1 Tax=Shewanella TaxID=22 RepID=UPI000C12D24B|nr:MULTISPECIES: POT family MFS transporter [Shewanella]MCD8551598.1 POT family MFS transporter [Shewanella xiamenensis]MCD8559313.1 POT family MFS transporter [Shewanella xiamenensis]NMD53657.1 POT family MFS transporter [Shewanella sp. DNRA4]PHY61599.1 MFS transporter [Shewanella xiamenensis]UML93765.1 POT family MFS transporter [Shewanella xiamenensis]
MTTPVDAPKWPRQIPYIIASEACERFSFYGMRNILTPFLMTALLLSIPEDLRGAVAKDVFHSFVIGVYFFPLLGGWIADRFFGKYNTILWLSLLYCVGHAFLAIFEHSVQGFYTGLFLIALGSGGIKPLVSSFMGDQFDQTNKSLAQKAFDMFYFTINFGSFFASLSMPLLLKNFGAAVAFGIPGVLMFIATVFFWLGRKRYVHMPPEPKDPHGFLPVIRSALLTKVEGKGNIGLVLALIGLISAAYALINIPTLGIVAGLCSAMVLLMGFVGAGASLQLERARSCHPDIAVDGVRSVLRILVLFALVTPFWSLFDQKASTWILQANDMVKPSWFEPAMMQALNPLLVMLLIPFNNFVLYPAIERMGIKLTALRKMGAGIAITGLSWIVVGTIQLMMDGGSALSIFWQILPYALLTFGEVLVSATGLEFAYSQAPKAMKGTIMSFWTLSVTVGNLWVLLANVSVKSPAVTEQIMQTGMSVTAFQMFFFAGFAILAALVFALYARSYQMQDHYRQV